MGLALALLSVQFLFPVQPVAAGDVFYYVDREGTMHFTNTPTDSRFRKFRGPVSTARPAAQRADLTDTILRHSRQHRVDPALIRAVIKAESDFDPTAVSRAGAMGLMQLMPLTALRLDVRDPYNPEENVRGGAQYLRYLLDRFHGNVPLALAAYNAGETRVERYRNLPPIEETRDYVSKVLRFYHAFLSGESEALLRPAGTVTSSRAPAPLVFAAPSVR
ncbi:MAG: lytic transglycosylase domain-containing protein [Nitrospira sp.]|nr:lytic transglycosylase domain-containing protein [Nitrospira sp.]